VCGCDTEYSSCVYVFAASFCVCCDLLNFISTMVLFLTFYCTRSHCCSLPLGKTRFGIYLARPLMRRLHWVSRYRGDPNSSNMHSVDMHFGYIWWNAMESLPVRVGCFLVIANPIVALAVSFMVVASWNQTTRIPWDPDLFREWRHFSLSYAGVAIYYEKRCELINIDYLFIISYSFQKQESQNEKKTQGEIYFFTNFCLFNKIWHTLDNLFAPAFKVLIHLVFF